MSKERYSILFNSKTGNTKELAEVIREALPQENCDYFGAGEEKVPVSEMLYIGFWTDKGTADTQTIEFLKQLKNKKIFLFGTAGYGGSQNYFEGIIKNVKKNIDSSNTLIGTFMCQGKMPLSVKERYKKRQEQNNSSLKIDDLIANFDRALSHPDAADLKKLEEQILNS